MAKALAQFGILDLRSASSVETSGPQGVDSIGLDIASPGRFRNLVGTLAGALILISFAVEGLNTVTGGTNAVLPKLVKAFSVDLELNVPVFFSMLLLLFASLLLALTARLQRRLADQPAFHWALLSLGFLFMAFDEIVSAHEKLIEPMRAILGGTSLGIFYYAWVVPAVVLLLALGVIFLRFWLRLPSKTRFRFALAGILYVGGAVGMEMVNGAYFEIYGRDLAYIGLTTVEESLEIAGLVLFNWALLDHIGRMTRKLELKFN